MHVCLFCFLFPMGHINTTANDANVADDAATAPEPIDLTDPATDAQLEEALLLLEEQKHDADEDTTQGYLNSSTGSRRTRLNPI